MSTKFCEDGRTRIRDHRGLCRSKIYEDWNLAFDRAKASAGGEANTMADL